MSIRTAVMRRFPSVTTETAGMTSSALELIDSLFWSYISIERPQEPGPLGNALFYHTQRVRIPLRRDISSPEEFDKPNYWVCADEELPSWYQVWEKSFFQILQDVGNSDHPEIEALDSRFLPSPPW